VTVLADGQVRAIEKEKRKSSVLGRLDEEQKSLFTLLAATDWRDSHPTMPKEALRLLEDRDAEKTWNIVRGWERLWPGTISKPAFIQFLASGYIGENRPGGFTAFMFSPPRQRHYGKKDAKRSLKNVLGKSGEIDDDDLEFYAHNDFYIPQSIPEAELQLELATKMLGKLTHDDSIATDGYSYGLHYLTKYRREFYDCQRKDKWFAARYVNFTDTVFRNFAEKLAEYRDRRDPIRSARQELEHEMERDIKLKMKDIEFHDVPRLPLPQGLSDKGWNQNAEKEKDKAEGQPKKTRKQSEATNESDEHEEWWSKNPNPKKEWKLPPGKNTADLFNKSAKGRMALAKFPFLQHHNPKVKQKRKPCFVYQFGEKCRSSCGLAHIPPDKMDPDDYKEMDAAFKAAFS
jgi:hypothetical protein